MKSKNYDLKTELMDGLCKYGRDTNISPKFIIESLVEDFLVKKGYLVISNSEEFVSFPSELNKPPIRNTSKHGNGLQITKVVNGHRYRYGTCGYDEAKILVKFLESENWNRKYSTAQTKLKGKEHIDFLFTELEKRNNLKEML